MMRLNHFRKNFLHKNLIIIALMGIGLAGCASTVSINDIENNCRTQTQGFAAKADCITRTYRTLPSDSRGTYSDLDIYFVDQVALLAEQLRQGKITETEAEAALSRVRMEVESQRRERNYQYDRGRFGVGVGMGSGGSGYWGHYGY